jgi:hypothetical protein
MLPFPYFCPSSIALRAPSPPMPVTQPLAVWPQQLLLRPATPTAPATSPSSPAPPAQADPHLGAPEGRPPTAGAPGGRSPPAKAALRPGASWKTISSGQGSSASRSILENNLLQPRCSSPRLFNDDRRPGSSSPSASTHRCSSHKEQQQQTSEHMVNKDNRSIPIPEQRAEATSIQSLSLTIIYYFK